MNIAGIYICYVWQSLKWYRFIVKPYTSFHTRCIERKYHFIGYDNYNHNPSHSVHTTTTRHTAYLPSHYVLTVTLRTDRHNAYWPPQPVTLRTDNHNPSHCVLTTTTRHTAYWPPKPVTLRTDLHNPSHCVLPTTLRTAHHNASHCVPTVVYFIYSFVLSDCQYHRNSRTSAANSRFVY